MNLVGVRPPPGHCDPATTFKRSQDLYYRLKVFPIEVAPLRQRREDIPILAAHYLEAAGRRLNRPKPALTQGAVAQLENYDWPGNERELQNVIERAVITSRGDRLRFDLPVREMGEAKVPEPGSRPVGEPARVISEDEMRRREKENTLAALQESENLRPPRCSGTPWRSPGYTHFQNEEDGAREATLSE